MFVTASGRRSVRFRPLEVPDVWPAAAVIVSLGLLLVAGGGPLHSALATFALGTAGVIGALWLRGARRPPPRPAARRGEPRGADRRDRLAAAHGDRRPRARGRARRPHRRPAGPPRSVAAIAREVAAATRSAGVPVALAVDEDATVAGLDGAIRALIRRAAAQGAVGVAVTTGRVEVRDEGSAAIAGFDGELAGGLARRAGAAVHLFEGLAVLELPARRAG